MLRESNLDADVLILGGGIAGLAAARALHNRDVTDFLIIEAQSQLSKVVRCLADEFLINNDPRVHLRIKGRAILRMRMALSFPRLC